MHKHIIESKYYLYVLFNVRVRYARCWHLATFYGYKYRERLNGKWVTNSIQKLTLNLLQMLLI